MKSLMTFAGILAFNFLNVSQAAEFACPLSEAYTNYTCAGTVRVQSIEQLNAYKNNLGVVGTNSTVAKALLIDFSPSLTEDIVIATPCAIKTSLNISINTTGNICLNAKKGVLIEEGFHFAGKNLKLESTEDVVINKNSVINAQDIRLLSKGSEVINQAFIRDGAQINATNITIESLNKGFIGRNSNVILTGTLGIYSKGDEEASVREGARVEANKIDIQSSNITTIANITTMIAPEINLNGVNGCNVSKGATITATERIGNCFLTSLTAEKFSIDKNRGNNPLTVTFNASTILEAKGYVWNFGDGQTLSTLSPTTTHTYSSVGSFTASLMYATQDNYKVQKSAGSVQIDVKAAPVIPTTPPRGYFTYTQDGTFVYLKGFIRKTQFDIARAYYVIDDNQNNKIYMTNFYANSQSNVEMNTFGSHKITMYVEDVQGQKYNTSMNIFLQSSESQLAPIVRFYGEQSAPKTIYINMAQSFIPTNDEYLKDFKVEFGDGTVEEIENASGVVHTYNQAGTYNVKVTAEYNGNIRSVTQAITVTNTNTPALLPNAGFYYYILEYSGNVVLTDERSSTPNGEIISYEWDFGNGIKTYGQQASHFFQPGNHIVTLTITDFAGLKSSQSQLIHVEELGEDVVAAIGYSEVTSKNVSLEIFALDKLDQISRVKIEWGDGSSQLINEAEVPAWGLFNITHNYQNYGTYNVKLTVNTSRGITKISTAQILLTINPPVANINCFTTNMSVSCNGLASYDPSGSSLSYTFDYGDSFVVTNNTGVSSHLYNNAGTYTVKLKITNQNGVQAFAQMLVMPVQIQNPLPVPVLFCYSSSVLTLTCNARGSSDQNGLITSYKYIWDDQGSTTLYTDGEIKHTFPSGGNYNVTLIVTDNDGGSKSLSVSYNVIYNNPPVALINCISPEVNKVHCDSQAHDLDIGDMINEYKWEFGDGNSVSTLIPSVDYIYITPGTYNVKLTVKDSFGEVSSITQEVTTKLNLVPVNHVNCYSQNPLSAMCTNFSYDPEGLMLIHEWFVDDVATAFDNNSMININFNNSGIHKISLKLTDVFGEVVFKDYLVDVLDNRAPAVNLICSSEDNTNYSCDSNVTDSDGQIVSSEWTIEGKVLPGNSILYQFKNGGEYVLQFKTTDNMGKVTVAQTTITVNKPIIGFTCNNLNAVSVRCAISESELNLKEMSAYQIKFDDKYLANNKIAEYTFSEFGEHEVIASVLDVEGTTSEIEISLNLTPAYIAPSVNIEYEVKLDYKAFFDASKSLSYGRKVARYEWSFGDNSSANTTDALVQHNYPAEGFYEVSLKIIDLQGAEDTITERIYVYNAEVEAYDSSDDIELMGIDTDVNNIRDDVQIWINSEIKDNIDAKIVIKKFAKHLNQELLDFNDIAKSRDAFVKEENYELCLSSKIQNKAELDKILNLLKVLTFNSEKRVLARMKITQAAAGTVSLGSEAYKNPSAYCEGL